MQMSQSRRQPSQIVQDLRRPTAARKWIQLLYANIQNSVHVIVTWRYDENVQLCRAHQPTHSDRRFSPFPRVHRSSAKRAKNWKVQRLICTSSVAKKSKDGNRAVKKHQVYLIHHIDHEKLGIWKNKIIFLCSTLWMSERAHIVNGMLFWRKL